MSGLSLGDSRFPPWVSPGHHLRCSEGTLPNKPQRLVHPHRLCRRCPETLCSGRAGSARPEPWAGWMVSGDPARMPPLPPLDSQGRGAPTWSLSLSLWSGRGDRIKLQAPREPGQGPPERRPDQTRTMSPGSSSLNLGSCPSAVGRVLTRTAPPRAWVVRVMSVR